ncbi:MAG: Uma2 family endonuclease [Caldilineaceae bacterium]
MSIQLKVKPPLTEPVEYPEGDGKPMAESDLHREIMFYIIHLLQRFFAGQRVYVSGNLLVYYEKGDPYKVVAPDCFVVREIDPQRRPTYKIWEEGKGPEVVFEVSSKSTKRVDLNAKMRLYAELGVHEYFIYDPTRDYLNPPLAAYVLTGNRYTPMQPLVEHPSTIATPQYRSSILGLRLALDDDNRLQFFDTITGERLLTDDEARQQAEQERQQAEQLAKQALTRATQAENNLAAVEAENARLRAALERLRGESTSA